MPTYENGNRWLSTDRGGGDLYVTYDGVGVRGDSVTVRALHGERVRGVGGSRDDEAFLRRLLLSELEDWFSGLR